jgi:hypothetical protein
MNGGTEPADPSSGTDPGSETGNLKSTCVAK